MKRRGAGIIGSALFVVATNAAADDVAEGRAHFSKGVALFRDRSYSAALVEFNAAYSAAPSFRIQYNIAQTCNELRDYACAYKAFSKFLADGGKDIPKDQLRVAESETRRLKGLVSNVYITVNLAGAEVAIDDVKVGVSPLADPVLVSAGRHTVTALKSGLPQARTALDVAGGVERIEANLEISEPKAAPPPPPSNNNNNNNNKEEEARGRLPMWLGIGATGVLAATTVTFGILTLGAKSDLNAEADRFGTTPRAVSDAQSRQDTFAVVTDVVLGATILAAGVTTVLVLLQRR
jgi:hypothetical protein